MPKLPRDIGCSIDGCQGSTYAKGLCREHHPGRYQPRFTPGRVSCKRTVAENLAACSERDAETGCLIWIGHTKAGYGKYGSNRMAHRVSYEHANGPIPDGLLVCHRCDRPACIEPSHLFLGTTQDNTADCFLKGRHRFVKLTREQVVAIRSDPRPRTIVAEEYGVSVTSIRRICSRKAWRFVA